MYVKVVHHREAPVVPDKHEGTECKVVPYTTDLIEIPSKEPASTRIKYNKVRVRTEDLVRGFSEEETLEAQGDTKRVVKHKLPEGSILGDCPSSYPLPFVEGNQYPETEYIELWLRTGESNWEAYSLFDCDMFVMNNEGKTLDIVRCH